VDDPDVMFKRELQQAGHSKRFSIHEVPGQGWEVREENDRQVVRSVRYRDWHRVERARMRFDAEVTALEGRGWSTRDS
jgi:hypothetical protein